jgi:ribosomal protein L23
LRTRCGPAVAAARRCSRGGDDRANQRAGTASTKTKGEVAGSGKKPWRRRAPAMPAPATPVARCGAVAAWCSVPSPAAMPRLNRKTVQAGPVARVVRQDCGGQLMVVDEFAVSVSPRPRQLAALAQGPQGRAEGAVGGGAGVAASSASPRATCRASKWSRRQPEYLPGGEAIRRSWSARRRWSSFRSVWRSRRRRRHEAGPGKSSSAWMLTEKGSRLSEQDNKYLFEVVHPRQQGGNQARGRIVVQGQGHGRQHADTARARPSATVAARCGFRSSWKRAIVTLKAGDKIDLT